jgi:hypothetical protein
MYLRCYARECGHPVITEPLAITGSPPARGREQKSIQRLRSPIQFSNNRRSQRSAFALRLRRTSPCPRINRGSGAPSGAAISLCARTVADARRLSARQPGQACAVRAYLPAISVPGSAFPGFLPVSFHLKRQFASSACRASRILRNHWNGYPVQRSPRRAAVVPPDRVPGPPECGVTSPARRRRIPNPAIRTSHDNALDWMDGWNIVLVRN